MIPKLHSLRYILFETEQFLANNAATFFSSGETASLFETTILWGSDTTIVFSSNAENMYLAEVAGVYIYIYTYLSLSSLLLPITDP